MNLTAANRAIVFDHWWHEGWERQAFARVHRIGQTKEVHTAKLVAAGSMDETILAMQAAKREKIGTVVGHGGARPKFNEICDALYKEGYLDEELYKLARVDDITDDNESDGFDGSDEDDDDDGSSSSSGSESDGDSESESETESDSVYGDSDGDDSDADSKDQNDLASQADDGGSD